MRICSVDGYVGEDASAQRVDRVSIVLDMTKDDADRLAPHMIDRGDGTILAAEAKEIAVPVVQALVDAGYKAPT